MREFERYLGKQLREKRQKLGMTLTHVGDALKVSHQQIQKYEMAQSRISAEVLYKISQLYGVPYHYFFEGFQDSCLFVNDPQPTNDVIIHNRDKPLNILLVEDDPSDELLTRRALEASDHKVNIFSVHNGIQALEFLRCHKISINFPRPDIILLDLNMPKRDGHSVLKELKRDRELQDIPVIILTNSISAQEMISVYKHQASGYISKSFDFDAFQKSILRLVDYWGLAVILPNTAQEGERLFLSLKSESC